MTDQKPTQTQIDRTTQTIRRIAELRIKALGLTCTVDEYLKKCKNENLR